MANDTGARTEMGPCCACGREGPLVRNLISLDKLAPVPGTGWGCVVCHQPNDGAMAIVCDECLAGKRPYQFAIRGMVADRQRVPIGELAGSFGHNLDYHRGEPDLEFADVPDWTTRAGAIAGASGFGIPLTARHPNSEPVWSAVDCGSWFLWLPNQHPFWRCYQLSVVHLRPVDAPDGVAVKHIPEATHELGLYALDQGPDPHPDRPETLRYLSPINITCQFAAPSDADAGKAGALVATALVEGRMLAEPEGIRGARRYNRECIDACLHAAFAPGDTDLAVWHGGRE